MRSIPTKESMVVEFKQDPKSGLKDSVVVEAGVGLTNAEGGTLFIGITDSGEVTGVHSSNWADPVRVAAFIASHTVPPITVRAERIQGELPFPVMVVDVPKGQGITATIDGKIIKRRLKVDGRPENYPFFPSEFNTRLSDLGRLDFTARTLPEAVYSDLDPAERERLRDMIGQNQGDRAVLELEDEDFDKALHLATEENGELRPTVAGLLMIGKKARILKLLPTVGATLQVFEGTTLRVNKDIGLPILASLLELENGFEAWNFEHEYEDGLFRIGVTEFSKEAFREALINAFTHRDYTCLGRISVRLLQEGLEITSPGGFINGVSLNNLLTVEPRGRNPALADCLKRTGLAERSGRGIDRIFEGSLLYGRPLPDYAESTDAFVRVLIPRGEPDMAFVRFLRSFQGKRTPGQNALSVGALLILDALRRKGDLALESLARELSFSAARVRTLVLDLERSGMVRTQGDERVSLALTAKAVAPKSAIREDIGPEEKILGLARTNGSVTRGDLVDCLGVSGSTAYRILADMVGKGRLVRSGSGRWARYSAVQA